jgi:hypothetical protein
MEENRIKFPTLIRLLEQGFQPFDIEGLKEEQIVEFCLANIPKKYLTPKQREAKNTLRIEREKLIIAFLEVSELSNRPIFYKQGNKNSKIYAVIKALLELRLQEDLTVTKDVNA